MSRRSRRRPRDARGTGGRKADGGGHGGSAPDAGRAPKPGAGGPGRGRPASDAGGRGARSADPGHRVPGPGRRARPRRGPVTGPLSRLGVQLAELAAVFGLAVLVAELAGAANLGVALGVGQIAFAIALVYLLLRR
jgi:hypothetical protein